MDFMSSQTQKNLARAFAGECQDGARYQFLSKTAKSQQLKFLSDTMKTLAKNEMAHASRFYDLLITHGGKEMENIEITAGYPFDSCELEKGFKNASKAEISQAKNIYPSFAKVAKDEGFADVAKQFMLTAEVENQHGLILAEIDKKYNGKKLYKEMKETEWKCSNCGHRHNAKEAWKECPLCTYPQGYVISQFENK